MGEHRERGFCPPHGEGNGKIKIAAFSPSASPKIVSQQLILASSSPRRKDLLASIGLVFQVVPAELREVPSPHEAANDFAVRVAEKKALTVGNRNPHAWVIAADTVVSVDGKILGKPPDREGAKKMLRLLANREHVVITGYTLLNVEAKKKMGGVEETLVKINSLDESAIDWYINTEEPFDKAGGYAIQGKGAFMVEWIRGSYTNVVGLPLCQLIGLFKDAGIIGIF